MPNSPSEQSGLWKQYRETKSSAVREKLILEYSSLVKYVAGRLSIYFANNIEYDDLISYGIFGLIDAIDKFDSAKGVKFETYASLRIRGAIIDSVRQLDWAPRTLRQKNREIERTYIELEHKLGHPPLEKEVAMHLEMNIEDFHKVINAINISHVISLDEYLEQSYEADVDSFGINQYQSPSRYAEVEEIKRLLEDSIEKLSEQEKRVITLYYFEELTLKEISAIMKVSESRISQIHSKAVTRLRSKLNKHRSILYED